MKLKIEIEKELTQEFLADIINTAVEGGIDYWIGSIDWNRDEKGNYLEVTVVPEDEEEEKTVKIEQLPEVLKKIIEGTFACRKDIRDSITSAVLEVDAGDIDADCADVIFQFACFGELVYG